MIEVNGAKNSVSELRLPDGSVAIYDTEDSDIVGLFKWYKNPAGHIFSPPTRVKGSKCITIHGLIMMRPADCIVDHINGNKLDNRKENLRYCSHSENQKNVKKKVRHGKSTSKYKGVSWSNRGYWQVVVRVDGKLKFIGKYTTEQDAALAAEPYFQTYFHRVGVSII